MTRYGEEGDITMMDEHGSFEEEITPIHDYQVKSRLRRICVRVKVTNKQAETTEYLRFTDLIEQKRQEGVLYAKDERSLPSFVLEFPKKKINGEYFVVRTYTEIVL